MARESKRKRDERRFGKPERLADMAFIDEWRVPNWCNSLMDDPSLRDGFAAQKGAFLEVLTGAKLIVADNVGEYFYAQNPKETWHFDTDFPCCIPPFRETFIEFGRPSRILSEGKVQDPSMLPHRWGWLLETEHRDEVLARIRSPGAVEQMLASLGKQLGELYPLINPAAIERCREDPSLRDHLPDREKTFLILGAQYLALQRGEDVATGMPPEAEWCVLGTLIISASDAVCLVANVRFAARADGRVIDRPVYGLMGGNLLGAEEVSGVRDSWNAMMLPTAMALSFMHCKNVILEPVDPSREINRERKKAGRRPFVRYHTIDIEPMKKVLRTEGNVEANGLKKALHIVRGHFSTYSEERPLFGKVAGTFWIPAHVRGDIKQGIVISDYNVKAPANP